MVGGAKFRLENAKRSTAMFQEHNSDATYTHEYTVCTSYPAVVAMYMAVSTFVTSDRFFISL